VGLLRRRPRLQEILRRLSLSQRILLKMVFMVQPQNSMKAALPTSAYLGFWPAYRRGRARLVHMRSLDTFGYLSLPERASAMNLTDTHDYHLIIFMLLKTIG
jgi:hypothetical protein